MFEGIKTFARVIQVNEFDFSSFIVQPFSQEVCLYLTCDTHCSYWLDDEYIKDGPHYNDYYGFLSSPLEDINKKTKLEHRMKIEVSQEYYIPIRDKDILKYSSAARPPHYAIPNGWYEVGPNTLDDLLTLYKTPIHKRYDVEGNRLIPEAISPNRHLFNAEISSSMGMHDKMQILISILDQVHDLYELKPETIDNIKQSWAKELADND